MKIQSFKDKKQKKWVNAKHANDLEQGSSYGFKESRNKDKTCTANSSHKNVGTSSEKISPSLSENDYLENKTTFDEKKKYK